MYKKLLGSQLRINMVSSAVIAMADLIVMALSYRVYLSFLGYEKFGVWLILSTVLVFIQMSCNLGIEPALTKLVAEEHGKNDIIAIRSYATIALIILMSTGTIGSVIIVVFKSQIINMFKLTGENYKTVSLLLPYIGPLAIFIFITRVLGAILNGLGRMDITNYVQHSGRIVMFLVSAVLLYLGSGIKGLLIGNAVSCVFIHIVNLIFIRRITKVNILTTNLNFDKLKRILTFSSGIVGGSFVNMLISPFNKLIISRYLGPASIPIYDIAYSVGFQVRALVESGFRALVPEISRLTGGTKNLLQKKVQDIHRRAVKLIIAGGVPIFVLVILAVLYTPVFKWWLGNRYVDQIPCATSIMLAAALLSLMGVPAYYILIGIGNVRSIVISHVILAIANALFVLILLLSNVTMRVWTFFVILLVAMGISTLYLIIEEKKAVKHLCKYI